VSNFGRNKVTVTVTCAMCEQEQPPIVLQQHQLIAWRNGAKIQDVMPNESAARRELMLSGTCDPCFQKMFAEEE
jgi:hypothetical protein